MALKLLRTEGNTILDRAAKIYRDADWDEYRVIFYRAGVECSGADFHTDDKQDAIETAVSFCNNPNR